MQLNQAMFIDKFCNEATQVKEKLEGALGALNENPENNDEILVIKRASHSLKGLSLMLKFTAVGQLMAAAEQVSEKYANGGRGADPDYLYLIMEVLTALDESIDKIKSGEGNNLNWDELTEKLKQL
ncbi:MAG: Hpt domain-containing protein [Bacteroidetes bacterium]|nr:Hpt domain-containing protein [Bacteroidota bacterium]